MSRRRLASRDALDHRGQPGGRGQRRDAQADKDAACRFADELAARQRLRPATATASIPAGVLETPVLTCLKQRRVQGNPS